MKLQTLTCALLLPYAASSFGDTLENAYPQNQPSNELYIGDHTSGHRSTDNIQSLIICEDDDDPDTCHDLGSPPRKTKKPESGTTGPVVTGTGGNPKGSEKPNDEQFDWDSNSGLYLRLDWNHWMKYESENPASDSFYNGLGNTASSPEDFEKDSVYLSPYNFGAGDDYISPYTTESYDRERSQYEPGGDGASGLAAPSFSPGSW